MSKGPRFNCMNKISLATIDDAELAAMVADCYIDAFLSNPENPKIMRKLAAKKQSETFSIGMELHPSRGEKPWVVNTKDMSWAVIPIKDTKKGSEFWSTYDTNKQLLLHVRIWYGNPKNPKLEFKNVICNC